MEEKKDRRKPARGISRREFARGAALTAASAAVFPGNLLAQGETQRNAAARPPAQQQPAEPQLSPESRAEVEAKIQAIFRKYGSRLSEEQKADIRRLLTANQKQLETLRSYSLDNADEPATVLKFDAEVGRVRSAAPAPQRAKSQRKKDE